MTPRPSRFERVRQLYEQASECSNAESRSRLLAAACGGDLALRAEVEMLLSLRDKQGLAVDQPLLRLALHEPKVRLAADSGDTLGTDGRYRITRFLAAGGMGEVYAAVDQSTGDDVAIKLLRHFSGDRQNARARFEREAPLAARIRHPNVCRILAVGWQNDPPFCVMELLPGETLAERLAHAGKFTQEEALSVAIDLCDGLAAAHEAGIVHRDLKPGNVMLCPDRAVIIDFGLATGLDRGLTLTKTGDVIGTLAYLAPELLEENVAAQPAADLYSLGVILFEMLTGKKPHAADSPLRLIMQRARGTGNLTALRQLDIPGVWCEVIARCLEAEPARRWTSAHEIRRSLQRGQASWRYRLSSRTARAAIAAAGVIAAVATGWVLFTAEYRPGAEADRLFRQARAASLSSAPLQAAHLLEQAIAREPDFVNAHSELAVRYAELDQFDQAREQMLHATQALDRRWRMGPQERLLLDASRANVVRDYAAAAKYYGQLAPGSHYFGLAEAAMLAQTGQSSQALQRLEGLVRTAPGLFAARVRYGEALANRRRYEEAARELAMAEQAYTAAGNREGLANALLTRASVLRRSDTEDRRDLGRVRSLAAETGNADLDLRAIFREVMLDVTVYRIDEAVEQGTQAVARAQSLGLNALASRALGDIGYSLYIKRQPERARQFLEQSVQLAERSKDFDAAAANRIRWADALFTGPPRRPLAAIQVMEPAVQWYRRSRREDLLASSLAKWGGLLLNRPDRFAEAEQILLEALARAKKEHDDIAQVMALQRLAGTYSDRNLPKGIAYWNQALPLIRSTNILGAFAQMARSYAYFGDFATANQLLVEHDQRVARQPELYARKNAAALGATTRAQISYLSGVCSASLPEFDLPAEAAEVAALVAECLPVSPPRAVFERHRETTIRFATAAEHESDTYRAGRLWTAAALVSLRLGDYVAAEQYAHSAIGHFEQSGRKVQEIHPMLVLRRSLLRQKKLVEAEAATARALGLAREVGFSEPYDRFNGRKDLERLWAR